MPGIRAIVSSFAIVVAVLELPAARAALCSLDEMDTINSIDDASSAPSDCFVVSLLSSSDWSAEVCSEHADCIPYLSSFVDQLPDCSYLGVNVRESIADAVANCESATSTSSSQAAVSTDSSSGSNATDSVTASSATTDSTSSASTGGTSASADTGDNAASTAFSLVWTAGIVAAAQLALAASAIM